MSQAYPLLLAAASFAGLVWLDRRMPAGFARRLEAGPIIVAGGLAGARLGFVALRLPYFSAHPIEIAWLWQGGLSWIGAAAGALAASALAARLTGVSFWLLLDVLAVPATLVSLAAWTGCLVDSCAWGRTVDWGPFGYDSLGNLARRWPTQAVGMVLSGILLAALLSFGGRSLPSGLLGAFALAALAAVTTGLSLTRGDPSMLVGPWRIDTVAGSAVVLAAGAAAMWRRRAST
ncbi:MAG TPA: prolipoprotein diacylglyceryl transferase family protein [Anaerolineales bacterium]|nr:prolipoprotein diacylglyceryl transferase family protein [Anaerolineales bacterium]